MILIYLWWLLQKANVVTAIFTVLPQSPTHIRLVFRSHYCVEVFCRGNGTVGVRDGAYSMFDTREVVEGLSPAPGLRVRHLGNSIIV